MISCQNFGSMIVGMVIDDEVFQQIEESFLFADTAQHGFQTDNTLFALIQAFPLTKILIFAAQCADFGFHAVGEHHKSIEPEQLRDGMLIIVIVGIIGLANIHAELFELHKQQRNAVHKADNVRTAMIQCAVNLHFLYGEKVIIGGVVEVDEPCHARFHVAVWQAEIDGNAASDEAVFLLVGLHGRGRKGGFHERLDHAVCISLRHPAVQAEQSRTQVLGEQHLMVVCAPQRAVCAQRFTVVRINQLPAQLVVEQVAGGALNKDVFGIGVAHLIIPQTYHKSFSSFICVIYSLILSKSSLVFIRRQSDCICTYSVSDIYG